MRHPYNPAVKLASIGGVTTHIRRARVGALDAERSLEGILGLGDPDVGLSVVTTSHSFEFQDSRHLP